MKNFCLLFCLLVVACQTDDKAFNSNLSGRIGIFEQQQIEDFSFQFEEATQTYHLPIGESKTPRLLWTKLEGDFSLSVRLPKVSKAGNYGLSLFTDVETKKPIARLQIENDQLSFIPAVEVNQRNALAVEADYLKLERKGTQLTAYYALANETFRPLAMQSLPTDEPIYGGLFGNKTTEDLIFTNLNLTYLPTDETSVISRVEVLNLKTKQRRLLLEIPQLLETPMWHPDNYLLVNSDGILHQISLNEEKPTLAKMTLDSTQYITTDYGFSANTDSLFYSQQDSLGTNIYRIFLDSLQSGNTLSIIQNAHFQDVINKKNQILYTSRKRKRTQLYALNVTNNKTIALGKSIIAADYDEVNEMIYCVSKRSSKQKIWRLTTLGLQEKQLTFDDWQDWSPHPLPDGSGLIMLSFKDDGKWDDDLLFQETYLRYLSLNKENAKAEIWLPFFGRPNSLSNATFSPNGEEIVFISYSILPEKKVAEVQSAKTL